MDRAKRNSEIVVLVKAREMPMGKIAERYRLDVSSIYAIATGFILGPQTRKRCGSRAS
jgi:hypothetical protein